jgi:Protein kinase domain
LDELRADDPRQVGNYALLARLGAGGMGQVYLGRSLGGRHVAVKIIRADLAQDQSFRDRFAREVKAARRVSGAFTAPVIDADPDAPTPWLVTDYVHGPSLGEAVAKHGPLPLAAVLTLAARLAEGLGAVHAAGVIHRDLKPANVLLAEDGPRLIDFGISQAADFAQITSPTSVLGTPGFIAPELIQGDSVGPSSDIFTLGAVLAYAATGELPFGAGPADARTLRVLYLAPDLGDVPARLRPLLERCLAKDPAMRPTANEFLADLVAACPEAVEDREDWLPADILAEIRQLPPPEAMATSRLRVKAPPPAPPPALPSAPAGRSLWRPRTWRRRGWAAGAAAAVAALGTVIGLLVAHASTPTLPAPTGLFAVQTTATAITLGWNSYKSGLVPDQIEILENGKKIATVAGYNSNYEVAGLRKDAAYHFSTVAVSGSQYSAPSPSYNAINGHIAPRVPLSLADAAFNWVGTVSYKETYSSDHYWAERVGATWQDPWQVSTGCDTQACDATLDGSVDGISFTATLHRLGAMYTGSAPVNEYFACGNKGDYQKSTLNINLTVTKAAKNGAQWRMSSFKGTLNWNVPYDPNPGCAASLYQMTVSGG